MKVLTGRLVNSTLRKSNGWVLSRVLGLWVLNEFFQATAVLGDFKWIHFLIIHLSSFYGAIVFSFLVTHLKLKHFFFATPLVIEVAKSINSCSCIDYWDLTFSLSGIIIGVLFSRRKSV